MGSAQPMSEAELSAIEAVWAKAPAGPWTVDDGNHSITGSNGENVLAGAYGHGFYGDEAGIAALVASRAHVEALLAEVKRQRAAVAAPSFLDTAPEDELREWCKHLRADNERLRAALDDKQRAEPPAQPLGEERLRWLERTYSVQLPMGVVAMTERMTAATSVMALIGEVRRLRAPVAWSKEPPSEPGMYVVLRGGGMEVIRWEYIEGWEGMRGFDTHYGMGGPLDADEVTLWGPKLDLPPPPPKEPTQ